MEPTNQSVLNPIVNPIPNPEIAPQPIPSPDLVCQHCHVKILATDYFCPNCGGKIKPAPLSTGIFRQLYIYTISILLPPLGLWPGIKYLLEKNNKAKLIGIIAIILTIVSTIVTAKVAINFMQGQINAANQQLNQMQGFGY